MVIWFCIKLAGTINSIDHTIGLTMVGTYILILVVHKVKSPIGNGKKLLYGIH